MLTAQKQLFVYEYLQRGDWNATEAAIAAGYSPKTARQQASRLLSSVDIQAAIQERLEAARIEADDVLRRIVEHATGSMADFVSIDADGLPALDFRKARQFGKLHLVKQFKHVRETKKFGDTEQVKDTYEVELYDAQAALNLLGKHHRLFDRALEGDWQREMEEAGLNPSDDFEKLVQKYARTLGADGSPDAGGSLGGSETPG